MSTQEPDAQRLQSGYNRFVQFQFNQANNPEPVGFRNHYEFSSNTESMDGATDRHRNWVRCLPTSDSA
jgi:hypothetical protein